MHYYQFNIGDYRRDTHYLSLLEHGVYRQLLDMYYLSEEPIPRETEVVFRRLSAITDDEQKAVLFVLSEFFVSTETGWINPRCDDEIRQYHGKADRARSNGKLGGRPKKTKVVISGLAKQTEDEPSQKLTNKPINPLTNNKENKTKEKSTAKPAAPVSLDDLVELNVENQVAIEFLALRKRKKATLTPLALQGIQREAETAGITLNDALRTCVERGWQSIKADWIAKDKPKNGVSPHGNFAKQDYRKGVGEDGSF